jgi:hypothetical protein
MNTFLWKVILLMKVKFIHFSEEVLVFFLKSGKIGYVLPKYKNFAFLKITAGYFFGEVDLLFYGEIRKYTALALRDCEFYVLNKKDFKKVFLMEFRDIGVELYNNAYQRKVSTRKSFKEGMDYCKSGGNASKTALRMVIH